MQGDNMIVYEIWIDTDDGFNSNRMQRIEIYLDVEEAKKRVNELNDGCNWARPYYIYPLDLSKTEVKDFTNGYPMKNDWLDDII